LDSVLYHGDVERAGQEYRNIRIEGEWVGRGAFTVI
jgi:hypothetical protein